MVWVLLKQHSDLVKNLKIKNQVIVMRNVQICLNWIFSNAYTSQIFWKFLIRRIETPELISCCNQKMLQERAQSFMQSVTCSRTEQAFPEMGRPSLKHRSQDKTNRCVILEAKQNDLVNETMNTNCCRPTQAWKPLYGLGYKTRNARSHECRFRETNHRNTNICYCHCVSNKMK